MVMEGSLFSHRLLEMKVRQLVAACALVVPDQEEKELESTPTMNRIVKYSSATG